jgi:hypothetical protein
MISSPSHCASDIIWPASLADFSYITVSDLKVRFKGEQTASGDTTTLPSRSASEIRCSALRANYDRVDILRIKVRS